ncbi:MAG: TIGR01777 family oxidoreductase [Bacteroidetes bacterium]|nr:TIGR01777 family oxidoreductase [Bacteroidota bacterium]
MKVIITGGAGFIGQQLTAALQDKGHEVKILDHHTPKLKVEFVEADLGTQPLAPELFQDVDAIIHLAGKNLFGRWNESVKKQILESRVFGTRSLVSSLQGLDRRPRALISASAVGFYGDRGEEDLDEASPPGRDFLATVCYGWEQEARKAEALGLRTAQVRTAPVLGYGGLLAKLLPAFKLGLGGPIGSGEQWFPWVHIRDIVNIYVFALENESVQGPVNACAPQLVRNKEFARVLGQVLSRPAFLPLPKWALKIVFGDLADAVVVSQKVHPKRLEEAGYKFLYPDLREALREALR